MPQTRIATCCYCGTRAALVLTGETQHRLSCSTCGAPLSRIKHLKAEAAAPAPVRPVRPSSPSLPPRPRPAKKKKSKGRKIWGEVFDLIEDILD